MATVAQPNNKKHSVLGIISIAMPLIFVLCYWGLVFLSTLLIDYPLIDFFGSLGLLVYLIPPAGLVLAIIAIFKRNRKIILPIIGIVANLIAIILEILWILMMMAIG